MRRTRITAVVAAGLAVALTLAGCSSDPTNPDTSAPAATTGATNSAPVSDTGGAGTEDSGTDGSQTGGSESAPPQSGGQEPGTGPSGEAAEPGQAAADATGTLNIFMYQKPVGFFNPLRGASGPDNQVISLMYEPLLDPDPKTGELVPVLADALPEVSEDAMTFTFTLKEGLLWSDGEPFTSEDVVTTWNFAANPAMLTGPSNQFTSVVGVDKLADGSADTVAGITAPDENTVQIELTKPSNGVVSLISQLRILPAHVIADLPVETFVDDPYFQAPKVGIGPFVFSQYQTDQFVQLTANPNFRYKVGVKEVFLKILTADVATQQLQTGEVDLANIGPVDLETVQGFAETTVTPVETPGFVRAAWNQSKDKFKDPRVLQAFLYGVDRAAIVEGALRGQGTVRNSVFGTPWQAEGLDQYPYDPEKAKQLLAEAGWDASQEVELAWIAGGNPDRDAAAQVIQNQLKEVGLNIRLNQVQAQWVTDNVPTGKFDMFIYGGGNYTANPYNVIPITSCQEPGKGPNNGLFCNEEYQGIVEEADATADADARRTLYQDASKIENANPSQMWLYSPKIIWASKNSLGNFVPPIDLGANWWESWKWTKSG